MKYIFICLYLLTCFNSTGQELKPLSLTEAIKLALGNYPSIQSRQALVNAAKAHVIESKNLWLPSLIVNDQVNAGTDNSLIGAYFPMGIIPSASGGTRSYNNSNIALGNIAVIAGQCEVYNFGKYKANIVEAHTALNISEFALQRESYSIELNTILTYLQLVKYKLLLHIQLKNIERTQIIKTSIGAYVKSGLRPGVDTSIAASELSKDRLTYIDLLNTYTAIQGQLSVLTGIDTSRIQPDTTLNARINILLNTKANSDTGYMQQPYLQYYHSIYEDNMAQLNAIRKSYLPKVYLMGTGWMRGSNIKPNDVYDNSLSNGLQYTRYNYLVGAAISYNITDSRTTRLKANVQRFKTDATLQDYNEQRVLLGRAYKDADAGVQASVKMLAEIPIQLKAATDGYTQKLSLYNAGLTNIVDLTNALFLLNRAETDAVYTNDAALRSIMQRAYTGNFLSQLLTNIR